MSALTVNNVRVAGLSACVPEKVEENLTLSIFENEEEAKKIIASTGIERKHVVDSGTTASDLTVVAVEKMIAELGWEKESIDLLVYVCQSRDYIAPMTSCILQDRLGLSKGCCVMDVPLGCCGFVNGMSIAASMLSHGGLKRGLMINAETNSTNRNKRDRTVRPLFADAATVTALEYEVEPGIIRKGNDMVVNGMDVFSFAIKVPPRALKECIAQYNINVDTIDLLLLHQANKFIDEKIRKSIKIPAEKCPYCLADYGNVTCASIPLTLVTQCKERLHNNANHILACGFGVGLQWGCMEFNIDNIVCTDVQIYKSK